MPLIRQGAIGNIPSNGLTSIWKVQRQHEMDIYFKFCDENRLVGRCRNGEFLDRAKKRFIGFSPLLLLNVFL